LLAHDLVRKPVPTFRDHAPSLRHAAPAEMAARLGLANRDRRLSPPRPENGRRPAAMARRRLTARKSKRTETSIAEATPIACKAGGSVK
jgi:hypothetical protein